jgi:primosomal protein N' (replication factor Y)
MAAYYRNPLWRILELAVPPHLRKLQKKKGEDVLLPPPAGGLPPGEPYAVHLAVGDRRRRESAILEFLGKSLRAGGQFLLLHGEVDEAENFFQKMTKEFPATRCAFWHGELGDRARREIWEGLFFGEICAVSGTRSAALLPLPRLRAIAVADEENPNHRQESGIRFHCRDVALRRARLENVPCLLTAPAPSLETFRAAERGKIFRMAGDSSARRPAIAVDISQLPPVGQLLSPPILKCLRRALAEGHRSILLHPRRGLARSYCPRCGGLFRCGECAVPLALLGAEEGHRCPRCGRTFPGKARCGTCGGALRRVGAGIRTVGLSLSRHLPEAQILYQENGDKTAAGKRAGPWDILLCNVPPPGTVEERNVGPVVLLDGDDLFYPRNFRSSERAFQFLWRLSDRMGPEGELLIQTTRPDCAPLRHFLGGERESFCDEELASRRELAYPPHRHLALQTLFCENLAQLEDFAAIWSAVLADCCSALPSADWRGPLFPAGKERGRFRAEFWIFCPNPLRLQERLDGRRALLPAHVREEWAMDPF